MGFWLFMLVMDLLVPVAMVGFGTIFVKNPPGRINHLYGYRTARSMKNRETWEFAHAYCGKLWSRAGWPMLVMTVLAMLPVKSNGVNAISMWSIILLSLQFVVLIGTLILVERALKREFDEFGMRRSLPK